MKGLLKPIALSPNCLTHIGWLLQINEENGALIHHSFCFFASPEATYQE